MFKRKDFFRKRARKPRRMIPAKIILEAVKNKGGENCRVHLPIEKILDQVAYIKITMIKDMEPLL